MRYDGTFPSGRRSGEPVYARFEPRAPRPRLPPSLDRRLRRLGPDPSTLAISPWLILSVPPTNLPTPDPIPLSRFPCAVEGCEDAENKRLMVGW